MLTGIFNLFRNLKLQSNPQAISLSDVVNVSIVNNKVRSISLNTTDNERIKLLDNIITNKKAKTYKNHILKIFFKYL